MKPFDIEEVFNFVGLGSYVSEIEKELSKQIDSELLIIKEPIYRLLNANSKRLRPAIVIGILMSKKVTISKNVILACCAIELVHLSSLVHDDIIDNANSRWGLPTVNAKEGSNDALVIGDYLFAKANQIAALVGPETAKTIALTIQKLCEGEILEIHDQFNLNRTTNSLLNAIRGKTASLISAACQIAGENGGFNDQDEILLKEYGQLFGILFQLVDDLLDFLGDEVKLGKSVGSDVREGVYTMPVLFALGGSQNKLVKKMIKENDISQLINLLINEGCVKETVLLINRYTKLATDKLDKLSDKSTTLCLSNLTGGYTNWALNSLIDVKYRKLISQFLGA